MSASGGARRADSRQLVRQWAILRLLADSGRCFSVKELADQLDASKATIQRDLATLEQEFALIEEHDGKQKKLYRIDQKLRALEGVSFGTMELLALHAAAAQIGKLAGTPFHEDLRALIAKLRGILSPHHNGGLDAIAQVFLPHPRGHIDYSDHAEWIDTLADAIARRRVCRIDYRAAGRDEVKTHQLRPLRLVWHQSALYLLGLLGDRTTISTLAVQRLVDVALTDESFARPAVDLKEHARRAFGIYVDDDEHEVEVIFDQEIAWRVEERVFHPDEVKERLEDGRLRYRIRSSAQWEIIPWVRQFGAFAELVKPQAWRAELVDGLDRQLAIYRR